MTEYERAKRWRVKREMSVRELAERTGYGDRSIWWFERGQTPPSGTTKKPKPVAEWVFQRYKMACAGVEAELQTGKKFNWGNQ